MTPEFRAWPKIARLHRDMTITEKIDGTNACVIVADGEVFAQSRKRIITPAADNFGFAQWVQDNARDLVTLGDGYHYGEWWGRGIQRGYGMVEKQFSLFNPDAEAPCCCNTVPALYRGAFASVDVAVKRVLEDLRTCGSQAAPGFMNPEGIVVYHHAGRTSFKVTLKDDASPKELVA